MTESLSERARVHRTRAEEIRGVADGLADRECREALRRLADRYQQMAERLDVEASRPEE